MTKEQVNEIFQDCQVIFYSYYKYSFSFKCEKDGYLLMCDYGGSSDDIYRYDVCAGENGTFNDVSQWNSVTVIKKDGEKVFEHYDY